MIDLSRYKTVSFDIFDTLLLRPYLNPQHVWKILEQKYHCSGFAKARQWADLQTFRLSAERRGETSIEEAYEMIPEWSSMMNEEMNFERTILCPNHEILELWNACKEQGKKRIIVSDMYLSADFLMSVLREKGIEGWDAFYLSRDYDCRKSTGDLFRIVLQKEDINPKDLLHIGDNFESDYKQPMSLGIQTYYYEKISERMFKVCPFTKLIDSELAGALAIAWHDYSFDKPDLSYWNRLGFFMGGVLGYMYINWLVNVSNSIGITDLMFVARDGYILEKICNLLYPEIKTQYLYAPRLVSVAINGADGNDPLAVEDRKQYREKYLCSTEIDMVRNEYKRYISNFSFDRHTALIDGCSSGFSAQRLVSECVGKDVFCFYLLAMSRLDNGAALYNTDLYSLPFQMMSEFLFGAPERPIVKIVDNHPIYKEDVSDNELFKMSVSAELCDGALACVKSLKMLGFSVSPDMWNRYADSFMKGLTEEDIHELNQAKNAADVEQAHFQSIIWKPEVRRAHFIKNGLASFDFVYYCKDVRHILTFSRRGIRHKSQNISTRYNVINRRYE